LNAGSNAEALKLGTMDIAAIKERKRRYLPILLPQYYVVSYAYVHALRRSVKKGGSGKRALLRKRRSALYIDGVLKGLSPGESY
jgi:hypothetical protein